MGQQLKLGWDEFICGEIDRNIVFRARTLIKLE